MSLKSKGEIGLEALCGGRDCVSLRFVQYLWGSDSDGAFGCDHNPNDSNRGIINDDDDLLL